MTYFEHYILIIEKLLKNTNVSELGTGKNPSTALYSETTKPETFLMKTKTAKITKRVHSFKNHAHSYNVEILNSSNAELQKY